MDKLFSYPVYKFKVPDYEELNKKIISKINFLKNDEKHGIVRSNNGGWHSDTYDSKFPELENIIVDFYKKEILKTDKNIKISSIWANINNKNASNRIHAHGSSHFSGVYYVKVPKNSGNLYFVNTHTSLTPPFNYWEDGKADEVEYEAKEGDLYFFPGSLSHRVGKNKTNEDRISISWNVYLKDLEDMLVNNIGNLNVEKKINKKNSKSVDVFNPYKLQDKHKLNGKKND